GDGGADIVLRVRRLRRAYPAELGERRFARPRGRSDGPLFNVIQGRVRGARLVVHIDLRPALEQVEPDFIVVGIFAAELRVLHPLTAVREPRPRGGVLVLVLLSPERAVLVDLGERGRAVVVVPRGLALVAVLAGLLVALLAGLDAHLPDVLGAAVHGLRL